MIQIPVHIGLGSNLGSSKKILQQARDALRELPLKRMKCSSVLKSPPLLGMMQPDFLNQMVWGTTDIEVEDLLRECQAIEKKLGRIREKHWGPRTIDLDIISYGNQVNSTTTLKIPHPELEKRAFVLMPLKELSPNWTHPVTGLSIDVLLEQWNQISSEPLPEILDLDSI